MKFRIICTCLTAILCLFTACNDDDETWEDRVRNFIENRYPGATVTEYNQNYNGTKVIIRHQNITKDMWFNADEEWEYTQWDISSQDVPDEVISALEKSAYGDYRVTGIQAQEKAEGMFYFFDLNSGSREVKITVNEKGEILSPGS